MTRASDLLVRLGGDEFILVQNDVSTREQALALDSRILTDVSAPYRIDGHDIVLGTSVGIALLPSEQLTPDDLLARADQALYQAKRAGNGFAIYTVAPQLVPAIDIGGGAQRADERKTQGLR